MGGGGSALGWGYAGISQYTHYKKVDYTTDQENYDLVDLEVDPEIRPQVISCLTAVPTRFWTPGRFERFSSLNKLIRAITQLSHISQSFSHLTKEPTCSGWHLCSLTTEELEKARIVILKSVQNVAFPEELNDIKAGYNLSPNDV